ncbi:hypothetical protein GCM10010156_43010 [Planobispora rosea]|uniref:Peptidase C45 hydrolase domain-containing protein n=1 Tax=Planobispora rosea TaxID=35762 RepID=A0A8J3S309_PLARO|nr:C45 family peptidase [Planobispora rosea]GGS79658.1 hypothetical protein GCM10010156_43010 [Planobispora rosea]GIH85844.1 hypothetical protein Pro02_42520 [Planobispora rosea]
MTSIIAGGPDAFMTVRYLTVRGSQREIGRALAEEARAVSRWVPQPADPEVNARRMAWFERNWPQHHERLLGVAEVFGVDPATSRVEGLPGLPGGSGCSVVWSPASAGPDGRTRIGRNYDFFTMGVTQLIQSISGGSPEPSDEPPMASQPYVIATIPDGGLASTVITMNELDGCMEGINAAGLTVALLIADAEATAAGPVMSGPQVGVNEVQLPRFVLDTCEDAEQARKTLLDAEQYVTGVACHYLIADASGRAFVWERGDDGSRHVVEAGKGAMCVTNYLLHRHPDVSALPEDNEHSFRTYQRSRTLAGLIRDGLSGTELRDTLDTVAFTEEGEPWRTLWRSVFEPEERTMTTRFYLGEDAQGGVRYSDEIVFAAGR